MAMQVFFPISGKAIATEVSQLSGGFAIEFSGYIWLLLNADSIWESPHIMAKQSLTKPL